MDRTPAPFLACRDDAGFELTHVLDSSVALVTIGRRADNDVVLGWDPEASRVHVELRRIAGEWIASDDGLSRNGTFLNGERLAGQRRLRDGDSIRVGNTAIVFRDPAGNGSASETRRAARGPAPELSGQQRRVLAELCRPAASGRFAAPPSNRAIAEAISLSEDAVKAHLRILFAKFALTALPQNRKRAALVERALSLGVIAPGDLR